MRITWPEARAGATQAACSGSTMAILASGSPSAMAGGKAADTCLRELMSDGDAACGNLRSDLAGHRCVARNHIPNDWIVRIGTGVWYENSIDPRRVDSGIHRIIVGSSDPADRCTEGNDAVCA